MRQLTRKLFTCTGCGAEGLDEPLETRCHCLVDDARWVESVIYTAPPELVVPEIVPDALRDEIIDLCDGYEIGDVGAQEIWSACRVAIYNFKK